MALGQAVQHHGVQQLIAVEQAAVAVYQLQAVSVAVQRHAVVGTMLGHRLDQGLRRGGAKAGVDVDTVGLAANGHHLGAQLMEDIGRNVVGRTVGGVHHHLEATQRHVFVHCGFAKLHIASARVAQPAGLAQRGRVHPLRCLLQGSLHRNLPVIGQLLTFGGKELDAVVRIGVV